MSETKKFNRFYGSLFSNCATFAISPYAFTMRAIMESTQQPNTLGLALGIGVCLFFSTAVPILPQMTSLTFAIAAFTMSLALASMFITYPYALVKDALNANEQNTLAFTS